MSKVFGYVRISSRDQNEDRQMIAMREYGVNEGNVFIDRQSGKDFNRPQYKKMICRLKQNDLIVIKSIDRLGRNYGEIQEQWRIITKEKKADIFVIDMPLLDTRREKNLLGTFISDLVLTLLSYVAENERATIRQRQAEGIAAAKARGVHMGRFPNPLPENFESVRERWENKELSVMEAAELCGMAQTTFYVKARKNKKKSAEK